MIRAMTTLAPLSLLFSSCYSLSIAAQYLCLLGRGQELSKVERPDAAEQQLFERVREIKNFSENTLGLRPTQNYSRYVRLERDYLTAVVSAAPQLGFTDYLWNYPFVGPLPYRGYFELRQAQREAARLEQQGYDVLVRPVDAFSTLGYVRDPLFSYMARYSEARLANLIIHESFHATLFIRGDAALNESLANLVGNYGAQLYMQQKYGNPKDSPEDLQENSQLRYLVGQLRAELTEIYRNPDREQALQAKQEAISRWQQQFQPPRYHELFQSDRYRYIAEFSVNNAWLALFSLYGDPDNFLENIYQQFRQQSGNAAALRDFISLSRQLARKHGRKTRQALEEYSRRAGSQKQGK